MARGYGRNDAAAWADLKKDSTSYSDAIDALEEAGYPAIGALQHLEAVCDGFITAINAVLSAVFDVLRGFFQAWADWCEAVGFFYRQDPLPALA